MIYREISNKIIKFAKQYPVVTITGPRQSGKTTLCRMLFQDKPPMSLWNPLRKEVLLKTILTDTDNSLDGLGLSGVRLQIPNMKIDRTG